MNLVNLYLLKKKSYSSLFLYFPLFRKNVKKIYIAIPYKPHSAVALQVASRVAPHHGSGDGTAHAQLLRQARPSALLLPAPGGNV